jgi:hypothetical protein
MPPAMKHVRITLKEDYDLDLKGDWHIRCVCHIMNKAVTDCSKILTKEVSKLRTMLKVVRNCTPMRLEFKKIQVRFGSPDSNIVDVPNLDVKPDGTPYS